jgi:2-hydroxy-3-oxopropionate reductase
MAANLVKAGHDVVGVNRSAGKSASLVAAGGRAASSIAEAVADAELVAVMVPDSPDVQAVLAGDGGVFEHARPGTLVVDFSTIHSGVARALATRAATHGLRMLDAPVSGGEIDAKQATLSIMVGGDPDALEAARRS